jgi:hypothetical protein
VGRNQRIGLIVAAVVVAVVAVVIATSGGGESKDTEQSVFHLELKDAAPVGGVQSFTARKDAVVRIVISTDAPDQVHLHGYDVEREATPAKPAVIRFKAKIEGSFELESHTAEHEGKQPLIAHLHVEP